MRRGLRALGAVIVVAGAITRCASAPEPPPPAAGAVPVATPTGPVRFASLAQAEAPLLALEDRRAFEAATLEAAARSADPAARARAAMALGRIGDERAMPELRVLLGDASQDVVVAAAFAAGILGQPGLTAALQPLLLHADPGVASRAAWSLGFLEESTGLDALIAALSSEDRSEQKGALLRALWRFGAPRAAAAAQAHVADSDARIRSSAIYALARRPQESSLPALTAALSDPDADTAALAARALGLLGKPESLAPLASAMGDPRPPVAINAMMAVQAILEKNPSAVLPAYTRDRILALAGEANPNLAVPALALLRWFTEDREAFRRLWLAASAGHGRRQQVALRSLMAGLGSKSVSIADTAIASADPFLRAAAAEALAFLPEAQAAPRRETLAKDPEVIVRLKVLEGLEEPETVASHRALVDAALADPNPGVRAGAIDALARLEDPATLRLFRQAVLQSYGDPEPDVAIEAIVAAQKQAARPEAHAIVEAAYHHPSTLVSRLARRALVRTFHADPAALPWREYATTRTEADYAALLAEARRPWTARVDTEQGSFSLRLAGAEAPMTVVNFVTLARKGYFDGVPIHRVVPNFVVQDGDPTGTGNGGPGYEIRDEINTIPYGAGTVGMALAGPDTGGSQWFTTQSPQPHLDGGYTVFGQVVAGMDVVRRIEQGEKIVRVFVVEGVP